jgi:hypothetical protein
MLGGRETERAAIDAALASIRSAPIPGAFFAAIAAHYCGRTVERHIELLRSKLAAETA